MARAAGAGRARAGAGAGAGAGGSRAGLAARGRRGRPRAGAATAGVAVHAGAPERVTGARLITAVKTPYKRNGHFDLDAYDAHVAAQIAQGVEGFVVGGTTGEGQLMSWDEHIMLIAHTVNQFGDQAVIIGNTGSNNTREALHATDQGFNVGMHASLHINPYYGKTSLNGLRRHFKEALDMGPAIVYNVVARTGQDLEPSLIEELAAHENFLGVKECEGNERIKGYADKGINCWSGNDDEAHAARHEAGAVGVISVTSNVVPGLFARLMAAPEPELNAKLQPFISWLFSEPNPTGVNTALAMLKQCEPVFRLPYVPYALDLRAQGLQLMKELGPDVLGAEHLTMLEDEDFELVSYR